MHELKFAGEIISKVKSSIKDRNAAPERITIHASLSPLSHVTSETLRQTFEQLAASEGLKDIDLKIRTSHFKLRCNSCKKVSEHSKPVFACPSCKSQDFDIEKGKEFSIESIKAEDA